MAKRAMDILLCLIGIALLWPVFFFVAIAVKLDRGPVLYRAMRVGQNGKLFKLYKFRTMVPDADKIGPPITSHEDTRITRVGRWLRNSKLDELPQLINVLKGEMSLVGPRPEHPSYVAKYTEQQRKILNVLPGITSLATLKYRNEEKMIPKDNWEAVYEKKILPQKIAIDLEYFNRSTFFSDLLLILKTLFVLIRRGNTV
ncbi:MAG TPA: sugar transferase [Deltaproteobacteria bacterium]|nr:sugar transferase [Deltaproteobacteria bacterium]